MLNELTSADAIIDALGGTGETAKIAGCRYPQVVSNWRKAGKLPSSTFLILTRELRQRGYTAPPALWGMVETTNQRAVS